MNGATLDDRDNPTGRIAEYLRKNRAVLRQSIADRPTFSETKPPQIRIAPRTPLP